MRTEAWRDKETGDKRTNAVVVVDNRFGEVGGSFRFAAARVERQSRPAAR
jgi:single-strand DNA-binding protein